jgi:hypothetical protein
LVALLCDCRRRCTPSEFKVIYETGGACYARSGYYGTTKKLELPYLFNIRQDPYESYGMDPMLQHNMFQHKTYMFHAAVERIQGHLKTLEEYPPQQKPATLSIGEMVKGILNSMPTDK